MFVGREEIVVAEQRLHLKAALSTTDRTPTSQSVVAVSQDPTIQRCA